MSKRKKPRVYECMVCSECGSTDVRRDAWAEWDHRKQDWVLGTVYDAGHCENCDGEARLEEEIAAIHPRTRFPQAGSFWKLNGGHSGDIVIVKRSRKVQLSSVLVEYSYQSSEMKWARELDDFLAHYSPLFRKRPTEPWKPEDADDE
jgi:hypothetical protein